MSFYYHYQGYHPSQRSVRRLKRALTVGLVLAVSVAGWIGLDYAREKRFQASQVSLSGTVKSQYIVPATKFKTAYFQFQADEIWKEVPTTYGPSTFLYHGLSGKLVAHELLVSINRELPEQTISRVIPVTVASSGKLTPLELSQDCKKSFKFTTATPPRQVTLNGVRFRCNPHDPSYTVAAGIPGKETSLVLRRPGGATAAYTLIYKNVTAQPESSQFLRILSSFEAR